MNSNNKLTVCDSGVRLLQVTEHDKDLLAAICDILKEDCKREKCKLLFCLEISLVPCCNPEINYSFSRKL